MQSGDLIVFYGSLRPPFETRRRIGIDHMVRWVGPAVLPGILHDLGEYPALAPGDGRVTGDLYEVLDDGLAAVLDPFEGYDPASPATSQYVRERISLFEPRVEAWVYHYRGSVSGRSAVAGGDWVAALAVDGRSGTLGADDGP